MKQIIRFILIFVSFLLSGNVLYSQLVIHSVVTDSADCHGSATGKITISISGGVAPYYYYISKAGVSQSSPATNDTTYTFHNVTQGTYTCYVEDSDLIPNVDVRHPVIVSEPAPISIDDVEITPISCNGFGDGAINVTASGESGLYEFILRPLNITSAGGFFANLAPGNYRVVVRDVTGCTSMDSTDIIVISDPAPIVITDQSATDLSCHGLNDGRINVSAIGGTGTLTYTLLPNNISNISGSFIGLSPGNYTVRVTDEETCPEAESTPLVIAEPPPLSFISGSSTNVSCHGANDGTITVLGAGGIPPYSYTLSPGGANNSNGEFTGLSPGTYTVNLTDNNGCGPLSSQNFVITQPAAISITGATVNQISCHNSNDGEIIVVATGGNAPLRFTLNPGNVENETGIFSGLSQNTYEIIVTDNLGCTPAIVSGINIINPDPVEITNFTSTNILCSGQNNGTISVTATGGTGALSYTLDPGSITQANGNFTGLSAGSYTISVTDQNLCPSVTTPPINITEPTPLSFLLETSTHAKCQGSNDGTITVLGTGGSAPYTYVLSPGGTSNSTGEFTGLSPGTYTVNLTDNNGCGPLSSQNFVITQPAAISITGTTVNQISCHNSNNGEIIVVATGGNAPLRFTLNPGNIQNETGIFTGLGGNIYEITVTDNEGCTPALASGISIVNPDPISITNISHTDIECNGQNNGTISVSASGGTGALIYTLNPGNISGPSGAFTGLSAGTYTVSVTDQNTCPAAITGDITVIEPDLISVSIDPTSQLMVSCYGSTNGTVNISVSGGTEPYSYSWTGPGGYTAESKDIADLAPGSYSLTLTDSKSCVSVNPDFATITEPPVLSMSLAKTDINCNGNTNGSVTVTAAGGTGIYSYSRNGITFQGSNVFTNLTQNLYTIWVRDENSCQITDTISINEPKELLINSEISISDNKCFGDSLGEIRILNVSGGVEPYEYSINGGASYSSSPVFIKLPGGSYQTIVRDANGCLTAGSNHIISQPARLRIGSYSQLDVTGCYYNTNGQIAIEAIGGTGSKSYSLNGAPANTTGIFSNVGGGTQLITIFDENNCERDTTVFLSFPDVIEFTALDVNHVTGCSGEANGSVSFTGAGGAGSIEYSMDGMTFLPSGNFSGLGAGNYTLTIRDANLCTRDTIILVTEPDGIAFIQINSADISCTGFNDGNIEAIATGGTGPYTFTLNPIGTSNSTGLFQGLSQGSYTISVDDAAGCGPVTSEPITISEPLPVLSDSVTYLDITCFGEENGQIAIYAHGGSGELSYSVNDGLNYMSNNVFTGLAPGVYHLSVRDPNLCLLVLDTIDLIEPPALTIITEATVDVINCYGDLSGAVNVEAGGGTGDIRYSLDGENWQPSGNFINLPAGLYTVLVQDENGCMAASSELQVNEPSAITASFSTTIYKDELNKGSITIINPTGGTGTLEFSINGMEGSFSSQTVYTDLDEGAYTVVIRDQNACFITEVIVISSVPPLEVEISREELKCHGDSDGSITITVLNPDGQVEYSIDDSASWQSGNRFEDLTAGNYKIVVRDEAGRYYSEEVVLSEPAAIDIFSTVKPAPCNAFGPEGPKGAITLNVTGGTGTKTFLWNDGVVTGNRQNLDAGVYTVVVTDENMCTVERSITVTADVTVIANAGTDTTVCEGTTLSLNGQGGTEVLWSPAAGLSNPNIPNPVVTVNEPLTFIYTVFGMNECYDTDTLHIDIYPKLNLYAGQDTSVLENAPVYLSATGGPYESYLWQPPTGLSDPNAPDPVATLTSSQIYILTATDEHGCIEMDTLHISIIERLVIYSSFSPNDDGVNDLWDIDYAELYPDILVEVYSRWGERLFSSRGYSPGQRWDGFYRGRQVPVGTYYYVIVPYKGANAITGTVTIVR